MIVKLPAKSTITYQVLKEILKQGKDGMRYRHIQELAWSLGKNGDKKCTDSHGQNAFDHFANSFPKKMSNGYYSDAIKRWAETYIMKNDKGAYILRPEIVKCFTGKTATATATSTVPEVEDEVVDLELINTLINDIGANNALAQEAYSKISLLQEQMDEQKEIVSSLKEKKQVMKQQLSEKLIKAKIYAYSYVSNGSEFWF